MTRISGNFAVFLSSHGTEGDVRVSIKKREEAKVGVRLESVIISLGTL